MRAMHFSYDHRSITHDDGARADVYTVRFPANSLQFTNITHHDKLTRMRDAAHLRHYKALARGEIDPVIVVWACLEADMSIRELFPQMDTVTETGEHILSANSWITYVLRMLLSCGCLRWRAGIWEIAMSDSLPAWRGTAETIVSWLMDTNRLWLEMGSHRHPPPFLSFDDFDPMRNLISVGRCGFVRDYAVAERPYATFNTAFFLLEHDDFLSHHSALGDPYGLSVEMGTITRPPLYRRAAIWHTQERGWQTGLIGMSEIKLVLPDGTLIYPYTTGNTTDFVFHLNSALEQDIVLYTRSWGVQQQNHVWGHTPENPGRLEITVIDRQIVSWKRDGGLVIPQNGFVLSFSPSALSKVQQQTLLHHSQITYEFTSNELQNIDHAIQCGPQLIQGGDIVLNSYSLDDEDFWISHTIDGQHVVGTVPSDYPDDIDRTRAGRSGLGIDHNGDLLAVVVPGISTNSTQTSTDSAGATLKELAEYLLAAGAVQAINLDGGGSTQLFVDGGLFARQGDRRGYHGVVIDRMIPAIGVANAPGKQID